MKLEVIKVNEDGSADATVELAPGEVEAFVRIGIIHALETAMNSEKAKSPELNWPPENDELVQDES
jgi:post-segregation antitoxin (ccd killing protein)